MKKYNFCLIFLKVLYTKSFHSNPTDSESCISSDQIFLGGPAAKTGFPNSMVSGTGMILVSSVVDPVPGILVGS